MDQSSPSVVCEKSVSRHARPHLETHTRSKGHSAVAGIAYRQGLKLFDERAGIWRDYSHRSIKGDIVLATIVAPDGSPGWVSSPQELGNRMEQSERRIDGQVARDFSCPIPLGLPEMEACVLAQEMASFIAEKLKTPVAVAVHNDSDVDVLGEEKTGEKVGFHAHLYFPTRRLTCLEEEDGINPKKAIPSSVEETGFGSKLTVLSNKRTSSMLVEEFNAKWAELSNLRLAAQGLKADRDHRSYLRQGADIFPQPNVGQCATAMERRGVRTRKGTQLREALKVSGKLLNEDAGVLSTDLDDKKMEPPVEQLVEIISAIPEVIAVAPEEAAPIVLAEPDFSAFNSASNGVFLERLQERRQQMGALDDRSSGGGEGSTELVNTKVVPFKLRRRRDPLIAVPIDSSLKVPLSSDEGEKSWLRQVEDKSSLETIARRHHLVVIKTESIASKLEKVLPQPMSPSEKERARRSLVLVECLEKVLATLEAAQDDEEKKAQVYERAKAAALDADYQLDQAKAGQKVAQNRLDLWMRNRPKPYGLLGIMEPGKKRREELQENVQWKDGLVQAAKRASEKLHAFSKEASRVLLRVQTLLIELRRELAVTAVELRYGDIRIFEEFSKWLCVRQRAMLDEALPGPAAPIEDIDVDQGGVETGSKTGGGGAPKGMPAPKKPVPKILPELGRRMKR